MDDGINMITSKQELREYLEADNAWYRPRSLKEKLVAAIAHYPQRDLKRYLYFLRMQEYCINTAGKNRLNGLRGIYYEGRKNRLGAKLGIEIHPNCFGKGLQLYHAGVMVNRAVRAGDNCVLHGGNCIGNNGTVDLAPRLGSHVDIGYGATLIGDISIADDCVIGANALVNRSFGEPGSRIAGVPARKIN